jgi:hypothetical protein
MARVSTLPVDATVSGDDSLIGTDAEDLNITKNYKIDSLKGFILNPGLVVYSDNAAATAAGLNPGDIYRTGDNLKIVHI